MALTKVIGQGIDNVTVDSSGNVGIGTTSPSTFSPSTTYANVQSITETDQALTIGSYYQGGVDAYSFIKSSQVGSPSTAIDLRFFGGTSERMRIDSSGNLLVGTTSNPTSNRVNISFDNSTVGGMRFSHASSSYNQSAIEFYNAASSRVGYIYSNASSTTYSTSSDYRLKENVTDITGATERLKQLNPVRFNFIADADTTVDGFLAHEVQDVVPEAITGTKDAMRDEEYEVTPAVLDDDGKEITPAVMGTRSVPDYQGIDQSKLVPLLVATIQELEARITALEAN